MTARLASAKRIVVHARQVVVNERIGVDELDGGGATINGGGIGRGGFSGRVGEQRTHSLPTPEDGIAHRFAELDRRRHGITR